MLVSVVAAKNDRVITNFPCGRKGDRSRNFAKSRAAGSAPLLARVHPAPATWQGISGTWLVTHNIRCARVAGNPWVPKILRERGGPGPRVQGSQISEEVDGT